MIDTWDYRTEHDPAVIPDAWVWERLRLRRDALLTASDHRVGPDAPGDVDAWKDHDYGHGRLIRLAGSAPRCVSTTQTSNQNALSVCLRVPVVGSISAQRTPRWSYQKVRSL